MFVSFFVSGRPSPGGSRIPCKTKDGRPYHREASKYTADWRKEVALAARIAMRDVPKPVGSSPLQLTIVFHRLRPKFHFAKNGTLKPDAPKYPTTKPDSTKLTRSTEDALNAIVCHDDAQFVRQLVTKVFSETQGAHITIEDMQ